MSLIKINCLGCTLKQLMEALVGETARVETSPYVKPLLQQLSLQVTFKEVTTKSDRHGSVVIFKTDELIEKEDIISFRRLFLKKLNRRITKKMPITIPRPEESMVIEQRY